MNNIDFQNMQLIVELQETFKSRWQSGGTYEVNEIWPYPTEKIKGDMEFYRDCVRRRVARKLMDAIIYDDDFVNRHTPFDASKHYGEWLKKIADKVHFPNDNIEFYKDDIVDVFAIGSEEEKMEILRECPELKELDNILEEYSEYLDEAF